MEKVKESILFCGLVTHLSNAIWGKLFSTMPIWGVRGFKVDFMDRDDQQTINFLYKAAALCAEHHMLLDYHGTCKLMPVFNEPIQMS